MNKLDFPRAKFLLIGEIHGVRENLDVLKFFVNTYFTKNKKFIIAFEWPSFLSAEINGYLSGKIKNLSWKKWDFVNDRDGRISREHILFLFWLKKQNLALPKNRKISIICFDENPTRWNNRDKMMAQHIQKARSPVIAIMGNLHAQKRKFNFGKERYIPVGFHLSGKQTVAVKINYLGGKFYNHGVKSIGKIKKGESGLLKNNDKDFDYIYTVKEAHPITLLRS